MSCGSKRKLGQLRRQTAESLSASRMRKHRLMWCCTATECGRICERLVKGPGKQAHCVDIESGRSIDLYALIASQDSSCPMGAW